MSTVADPTGRRAARAALLVAAAMLGCSLLPAALRLTTPVYGVVALVAGGWFLFRAWAFARARGAARDQPARRLFLASIACLPIILTALVADRLWMMGWMSH
jgi:protoheme IX farnesyltransferase